MMFPKDNAIYSERYRRLVAALPCIRCGLAGNSQAAHPPPKGKAIKQDDRYCIPMCGPSIGQPGCHWKLDNYVLMPHDAAVEWVLKRAAEVRERIERAGMWPNALPRLTP